MTEVSANAQSTEFIGSETHFPEEQQTPSPASPQQTAGDPGDPGPSSPRITWRLLKDSLGSSPCKTLL